MVNTSKFTFAKQVQEKAQELQEVADEIVKRTVAAKGEVSESDCLDYNGELIDAARMLNNVTCILVEMSDALVHNGNDNSPSKKQKTENSQETDDEVAKITDTNSQKMRAEAEENGTAMKPGPEHWGHVSSDSCERRVQETPKEALGILESALAGLGYSIESVSDSTTLGAAWKRALLNEADKEASKAFKKAIVDVARNNYKDSQETIDEVGKTFPLKDETTQTADEKVTTAPPALSRLPSVAIRD